MIKILLGFLLLAATHANVFKKGIFHVTKDIEIDDKVKVNGGWSVWSGYLVCSVTCGCGIKKRTRTCTNPAPSRGGNNCVGDFSEAAICNLLECPINGGWSHWGNYLACSTSCGCGIKIRTRNCTNPAPSRGGNSCDGDFSEAAICNLLECPASTTTTSAPTTTTMALSTTKAAPTLTTKTTTTAQTTKTALTTSTLATATQIRPPGDKFCIEPVTGLCSVSDNTALVLRPTSSSYCQSDASQFVFNPKTGSLLHKCSNKFVCSQAGIVKSSILVVSSACVESSISSRLQRTMWNTLQIESLCFEPSGGNYQDGAIIVLWDGCSTRIFLMPQLAVGSVSVSFFDKVASMTALKTDTRYLSNNPTTAGVVDNFDFPPFISESSASGIRMQAFFKAPESGVYFFMVSCDDMCELLFTKDVLSSNSAVKIASCSSFTNRYQWNTYKEQKSSPISLSVGKQYNLEFILFNAGGPGYGAVAVLLPSGTLVAPISYDYLSAKYN